MKCLFFHKGQASFAKFPACKMGQPGGQESKTNSNISWIVCILNTCIVNIVKSVAIHKIP